MKTLLWIPIAIVFLPVFAWPQALPDAPLPVQPDAKWMHVEQISDGQPIVVRTTSGALVYCRFAGATDRCLFCDPAGSLASQPGYRFDRASIVSVREVEPKPNGHPVLLATMAIVGTAVGIATTRNTDNRGAVVAGVLSAGIVGLIAYPIVQMQSQQMGFGFVYRPHRFRPHMPIRFQRMR